MEKVSTEEDMVNPVEIFEWELLPCLGENSVEGSRAGFGWETETHWSTINATRHSSGGLHAG